MPESALALENRLVVELYDVLRERVLAQLAHFVEIAPCVSRRKSVGLLRVLCDKSDLGRSRVEVVDGVREHACVAQTAEVAD